MGLEFRVLGIGFRDHISILQWPPKHPVLIVKAPISGFRALGCEVESVRLGVWFKALDYLDPPTTL